MFWTFSKFSFMVPLFFLFSFLSSLYEAVWLKIVYYFSSIVMLTLWVCCITTLFWLDICGYFIPPPPPSPLFFFLFSYGQSLVVFLRQRKLVKLVGRVQTKSLVLYNLWTLPSEWWHGKIVFLLILNFIRSSPFSIIVS